MTDATGNIASSKWERIPPTVRIPLPTSMRRILSEDSIAVRVVMDATGKELSVTSGIKGHAVRMNVELEKSQQ